MEVICQLLGLFIAVPLTLWLNITPEWLSLVVGVAAWLALSALFRMLYLTQGALIRAEG